MDYCFKSQLSRPDGAIHGGMSNLRASLRQTWRYVAALLLGLLAFVTVGAGVAIGQTSAQTDSSSSANKVSWGDPSSAWVGDPTMAEARLVSAVVGTGDLTTLPLGLEIKIAPGWKLYWRTPGEAGLPPTLDFGASPFPVTAAFHWPAPTRFSAFGFDNFGYDTHVILPVTVTGHVPGELAQISAVFEALVCADICVPIFGDVDLTIPDGPATATIHARAMAEYQAMVPRRANASGVSATAPSISVEAATYADNRVYLTFAEGNLPVTDIFIEGFEQIAFKAPQMMGRTAEIAVLPSKGVDFTGGPAVVTIIAPPEQGEFAVNITPRATKVNDRASSTGFGLWVIGIALLGGLILNFMPCVLPVLALKLSAVLANAGTARNELRMRFVAGAAGIVTSFMILAATLALIKVTGGRIGWGIQFQNVYFLGGMILLLGVFAANMLGLFHFRAPAFAAVLPMPRGDRLSGRLFGDFLSGMLATILATPCSAPFVGTAVTVAFSGGIASLFGIFAAMGVGLALPWLLVAAFPGSLALLPRPGAWMARLQKILALLLIGTMVWLGTVIYGVIGPVDGGDAQKRSQEAEISRQFVSWTPDAIDSLLADGKVVFIDVTADWCITCKANKALVLDRAPLASMLAAQVASGKLVMVQADWTRPDAAIADYLARNDRFGIPFNAIYAPGMATPYILPEILTTEAVLSGLENAGILPK